MGSLSRNHHLAYDIFCASAVMQPMCSVHAQAQLKSAAISWVSLYFFLLFSFCSPNAYVTDYLNRPTLSVFHFPGTAVSFFESSCFLHPYILLSQVAHVPLCQRSGFVAVNTQKSWYIWEFPQKLSSHILPSFVAFRLLLIIVRSCLVIFTHSKAVKLSEKTTLHQYRQLK